MDLFYSFFLSFFLFYSTKRPKEVEVIGPRRFALSLSLPQIEQVWASPDLGSGDAGEC